MGSHLVDHLIRIGHQVYGVDDLSGGYMRNVNPKSIFTKLDLRNTPKTVALIVKIKPQLIYHLAADATEGRSQFTPVRATERNLNASLNILVGAVKAKTKRVVMTSSMSVYGDQKPPFSENIPKKPVDIYGISKAAMEDATKVLSQVYGFEYTIIRPHNVFGPKQNLADPYRNVVAIFINCLMQGKNFYIYGDGQQKRAFSFIDDVTPYIANAGFLSKTAGEIINVGPSKEYTINELANEILSHFVTNLNDIPKHLKPIFVPDRPQEVKMAYSTDTKAKKLLGFKNQTPLKEGVAKMVEWAKSVGPQKFQYLDKLELTTGSTPTTWKNKLI
ncbi:NAD-dependent epimerase/dehydratase family protein [Candidatus Daviesbacteria bacterium]|nr:NAD-dependent epimerase/dehydratase family protein [Candidatus Daviesbacteria bacterium]